MVVVSRVARWFSLTISLLLILSLAGPILAAAQEAEIAEPPLLQQAQVIVGSSLRAEPTHESPELEFLAAGTTVTLMTEPFASSLDGEEWVQVATLQSLGYLPQSAFAPPAEPAQEDP